MQTCLVNKHAANRIAKHDPAMKLNLVLECIGTTIDHQMQISVVGDPKFCPESWTATCLQHLVVLLEYRCSIQALDASFLFLIVEHEELGKFRHVMGSALSLPCL